MKTELATALTDVEGWLDADEAWALHEAARCFPTPSRDITVVAMSSWKGRSTIALALGLKARGGGKVYAIDPHTGSEQTLWLCGPQDTYDAFISNLTRAGVMDVVEPMRTTSHLARGHFREASVHLLHVDGSHEYDAVREYIDDWSTALTDGAIVALRDPFDTYPALRHRVLRLRSPFRRPRAVEGMLLLEFDRSRPWTRHDTVALAVLVLQRKVYLLRKTRFVRKRLPEWVESILEGVERLIRRALPTAGKTA